MATLKRVFTLRLRAMYIFDRIEALAKEERRSMTNLIEYIIIRYLNEADQHTNQ